MCGISGIINQQNRPVETNQIKKINDLISHRGPDDEGFYFGNNFAFGHRRLSIIDLSDAGHQPMYYLDRYVITYNGEIYNYIEIRDELIKEGYKFKSKTDTEVILASYDKWGEECVSRFNGMWAFAIYDKEREIIFCSRDRFGIKPFYYTQIDGKFIFGSEIKQLLEFYHDRYVNKNILADYLLYGFEEHTNETFFKDIYKLEQSHNLIYDLKTNRYEIKRYYDLNIDSSLEQLSEKEAINYIKNVFEKAIDLRLRSDVKVGTCLSGGLDSSSIAAIASKKYTKESGKKFTAIHAKSVEQKTDESYFAKEVAKYCKLDLKIVEPQLDDITQSIEEVVYTQEEPFGGPSVFMQYFVMKKAKEEGCKVMLDGQGGDETLFGYENYYAVYFATLIERYQFIRLFNELKVLNPYKIDKKQIIKSTLSILMGNKIKIIKSFLRLNYIDLKIKSDFSRLYHLYTFKKFKQFQIREMTKRNLPHLLKYEDKNSMKNSIETRLPFVDYKFVQSAISINDSLKIKNGYLKYILRKVIENILPKKIVWRTNKFGFEAPTDMWIDINRNKMIDKIKKSNIIEKSVKIDERTLTNNKIVWKLFNVAVWEEIYKVKI